MPSEAPLYGDLPIQEKLSLARGGSLSMQEPRLEVLIALTEDADAEVRQTAQETLDHLPDADCARVLEGPTIDASIARYFLDVAHYRPALLPLLLGHPDTPSDAIIRLAGSAGPEIVPTILDQLDLLKTAALLALKANPTYLLWQKQPPSQGYVLEVDLLDLLIQEMETNKPPTVEELEKVLSDAAVAAGEGEAAAKGGMVSKISRMKVAQRVKLALLGTREERALLIRDTSRVVFRAVLGSPKLTDSEVENFAMQRNVSQEVLRLISMSRKHMKNYPVLKNLANNPRTPIDVSLPLLNRLLANDLRAISTSREVPETLRKMAQKLIRSRTS